MNEFNIGNMKILCSNEGKFILSNHKNEEHIIQFAFGNRPNFTLKLAGNTPTKLGTSDNELKFCGITRNKNSVILSYEIKKYKLNVECKLEFDETNYTIAQTNTIKNCGENPVVITEFSSASIDRIGEYGNEKWYKNDELSVYFCHNKWCGEAQWQSRTPFELGVYPCTKHAFETTKYELKSSGSWSTGTFYPLIVVTDKKNDFAWFMELEGANSWSLAVGETEGYNSNNGMYLEASASKEENGGWHYTLKPNENYTARRAFFGLVEGGFEDAIRENIKFKRNDSVVHFKDGIVPIVYNTFMNGTWIDQSLKTIKPIIERAGKLGVEIFCLDDGWHKNKNGEGLGDWLVDDMVYAKGEFETIPKLINDNGMVAGLWTELEFCSDTAEGFKFGKGSILARYGENSGNSFRGPFNIKNAKVRAHLMEAIDRIYDMGFRYIKNDYNLNFGLGADNNNEKSISQGLMDNSDAFISFIREVQKKYPDLIIENCGSGAQRDDNSILRNFYLQSTSDQEYYEKNPSIVMGSLALMPPEKAGIWAYPYPVCNADRDTFVLTPKYVREMADGYQTAYNMVTGMFGCMYMSGRIDLCDNKNAKLIYEALEIYKNIRDIIPKAYPIYPLGFKPMNESGFVALGLKTKGKIILGVWKRDTTQRTVTIDMSKYIKEGTKSSIKRLYPMIDGYGFFCGPSTITVDFPNSNSAILFEINI